MGLHTHGLVLKNVLVEKIMAVFEKIWLFVNNGLVCKIWLCVENIFGCSNIWFSVDGCAKVWLALKK